MMGLFNLTFPFDTTVASRLIITYRKDTGKFSASLSLVGAADGYMVYSTGDTPAAAVNRVLESAERPERWRKARY